MFRMSNDSSALQDSVNELVEMCKELEGFKQSRSDELGELKSIRRDLSELSQKLQDSNSSTEDSSQVVTSQVEEIHDVVSALPTFQLASGFFVCILCGSILFMMLRR